MAKEKRVGRRRLLYTLGGGLVVLALYKGAMKGSEYAGDFLDRVFYDETVTFTGIKRDVINHNSVSKNPSPAIIPYAQFRDSVFQIYPIRAINGDMGPGDLIQRANVTYNPGRRLQSPDMETSVDLFNFLHHNPHNLRQIVENEITKVPYAASTTPIIELGQRYFVPVLRSYKSLDDLIPKKIDVLKTV